MKKDSSGKGRVLARLLAEDLRNVGVSGGGATTGISDPVMPGGRRDISNGPTDFDLPPD
jgi:hypothetical protein